MSGARQQCLRANRTYEMTNDQGKTYKRKRQYLRATTQSHKHPESPSTVIAKPATPERARREGIGKETPTDKQQPIPSSKETNPGCTTRSERIINQPVKLTY